MKRVVPLWVFPIGVILAVATVWLRLSIVKTTYEINQVERMISNAKQERERASLKLAGLKSPRRLELLSKTQFRLNQPRTDQVIYFK